MKRFAIALLFCLTSPALGQQAVHQSGNVTPGHVPMWATNGIIQDGGTAAQGFLTSLGVTAAGPGICQNSGPISGPYNQVCLNTTQSGGGWLSVYNYNGATGGFSFVLNGVTQDIVVANPPITANDGACFYNSSGTIKDCGFIPVPNSGWTSGLPLIGSNTGTVVQGTVSGNTTKFATGSGATTTNDCAKWDANGNVVDSGATCSGTVSAPNYQIFTSPGAVTTLTLTNTPFPTAASQMQIAFDGRLQARSGWSFNSGTDVITFTSAIPANVVTVEVDWFVPQLVAGVGSITAASNTITGAVNLLSGTGITLTSSGQNVTTSLAAVSNNTMLVNASGVSAAPAPSAPTTFWDAFCGNTIGYIWVRITGNWACSPSFDPPVTWFGAKCDGSTNDSTAINAAIASGVDSVAIVGPCAVTTLTTLPANFTLHGYNRLNDCLITSNATNNVVTMNLNGGDTIRDLCFKTSVTRTGGDYIYAQGSNTTISRVFMSNFRNGIEVNIVGTPGATCPSPNSINPCFGIFITDAKLYSGATPGNDGIHITGFSGGAGPYNDVHIVNVGISGNSVSAYLTNCIEIEAAEVVLIEDGEFEYCNNAVLADPNGPQNAGHYIQWLEISNSLLDAGGNAGLNVNIQNGGYIHALRVHDSWIASNASNGIEIGTDAAAGTGMLEWSITNNHILNNTIGIHLSAGASGNDGYGSISGNYVAGNSGTGEFYDANTTTLMVSNERVTLNGNGIVFNANMPNGVIFGNQSGGNTTNCVGAPTVAAHGINVNVCGL